METGPAPALPAAPEDDATGPGLEPRADPADLGPSPQLVERMRAFGVPSRSEPMPLSGDFKSGQWRAAGAIVGLGLVLSVLIVLVGHILEADPLIDRALAGRASMRELIGYDDTTASLNVAYLVGLVLSAVLWFTWQWRAERNLPVLAPGRPPFTPRASIGWWFAPFVSFVMVPRVLRDLVDRSAGRVTARGLTWALVLGWLSLFYVGNFLLFAKQQIPDDATIEQIRAGITGQAGPLAMRIGAAVLSIVMILMVQRSQAARRLEQERQYATQAAH